MESGIFSEDAGQFKHSASSRELVGESGLKAAIGMVLSDLVPASTKVIEAIAQYYSVCEPTQTGFNIANNTHLPIYSFLA